MHVPGDFTEDTDELLECAKINFENVEKMNPGLNKHPIYALAKAQLDECVRRAEHSEAEED